MKSLVKGLIFITYFSSAYAEKISQFNCNYTNQNACSQNECFVSLTSDYLQITIDHNDYNYFICVHKKECYLIKNINITNSDKGFTISNFDNGFDIVNVNIKNNTFHRVHSDHNVTYTGYGKCIANK